jgi:hypothetical protein
MDITLCSPTKYLKKCNNCLRRRAKPSENQSYANLYDECKKYNYINFIEYKEIKEYKND